MLSIKEVLNCPATQYRGGEKSRAMVEEQIKNRFGEAEVKNVNCYKNLRTYNSWVSLGYRPKRGSRSIRSITMIDKLDDTGKVIKKIPHEVCLFYYKQVEPIKNN